MQTAQTPLTQSGRSVPWQHDKSSTVGQGALSALLLHAAGLMGVWLVFSGRFEAKYIAMGLISVALVSYLNGELRNVAGHPARAREICFRVRLATCWRFVMYLPWLLYNIAASSVQVLWVVLHPRMPIDPRLLRFRTQHQSGIAQLTLANSITLTPGTITVDLDDGEYTVHALMPASAASLLTAEMQNRVANIFEEEREEAPKVRWTLPRELFA